jgi:hypothetical protein
MNAKSFVQLLQQSPGHMQRYWLVATAVCTLPYILSENRCKPHNIRTQTRTMGSMSTTVVIGYVNYIHITNLWYTRQDYNDVTI